MTCPNCNSKFCYPSEIYFRCGTCGFYFKNQFKTIVTNLVAKT